jgi:hypothetical protein
MMGRQARASVRVMRLWKPHDLGRSCLHCTIRHYVTNETDLQNAGALLQRVVKGEDVSPTRHGVTTCMPCSFGLLPHPRSEPCAQPDRPLEVTVTVRWIPLVPAAYGTRVARPARTTIVSRLARRLPAHPEGEARPRRPLRCWQAVADGAAVLPVGRARQGRYRPRPRTHPFRRPAGQVRLIGGGAQWPWRTTGWGAYRRMVTPNGPRGAGSQLDCLSAPGSSC